MALCLPKHPKKFYLLTGANHWGTATIYPYALIMCFSCPNPTEDRKRNCWKGDFEGMRRNLQLQDWNLLLVGDTETKRRSCWTSPKISALLLGRNVPLQSLGYKDVLLRCKRRKKSCIKKSCLHVPKSTGPATNTMTGLHPVIAAFPGSLRTERRRDCHQ